MYVCGIRYILLHNVIITVDLSLINVTASEPVI